MITLGLQCLKICRKPMETSLSVPSPVPAPLGRRSTRGPGGHEWHVLWLFPSHRWRDQRARPFLDLGPYDCADQLLDRVVIYDALVDVLDASLSLRRVPRQRARRLGE